MLNLNLNYVVHENKNPRDSHIRFEEKEHLYFIHEKNFKSCTTFIKTFFNPFDSIKISENCVKKKKPHISKENLQTESALLRQVWSQASADGTKMHNDFENFYNFGTVVETKEMIPFLNFARTMEENGFKPYRSEWAIYDTDYELAGTVDQLYYHGNDQSVLYMYDWKRSKGVSTFSFGKTGKSVNFYLNDCNFIHYALQQNLYKYILQKNYGVTIKEIFLFVVNSKNHKPSIIELPDMQQEIQNMLEIKLLENRSEDFQEYLLTIE
jgi:hypothetical protein